METHFGSIGIRPKNPPKEWAGGETRHTCCVHSTHRLAGLTETPPHGAPADSPCCSRPLSGQLPGPWPWRQRWTPGPPVAEGGRGWVTASASRGPGQAVPACAHGRGPAPGSAPTPRPLGRGEPGGHLWYQGLRRLLMASGWAFSEGLEAAGGRGQWQRWQSPRTRPVQRGSARSHPWRPGSVAARPPRPCRPPWGR